MYLNLYIREKDERGCKKQCYCHEAKPTSPSLTLSTTTTQARCPMEIANRALCRWVCSVQGDSIFSFHSRRDDNGCKGVCLCQMSVAARAQAQTTTSPPPAVTPQIAISTSTVQSTATTASSIVTLPSSKSSAAGHSSDPFPTNNLAPHDGDIATIAPVVPCDSHRSCLHGGEQLFCLNTGFCGHCSFCHCGGSFNGKCPTRCRLSPPEPCELAPSTSPTLVPLSTTTKIADRSSISVTPVCSEDEWYFQGKLGLLCLSDFICDDATTILDGRRCNCPVGCPRCQYSRHGVQCVAEPVECDHWSGVLPSGKRCICSDGCKRCQFAKGSTFCISCMSSLYNDNGSCEADCPAPMIPMRAVGGGRCVDPFVCTHWHERTPVGTRCRCPDGPAGQCKRCRYDRSGIQCVE